MKELNYSDLFDLLVSNKIATEDELELVLSIAKKHHLITYNSESIDLLNEVLEFKTDCHNWYAYAVKNLGFPGENELQQIVIDKLGDSNNYFNKVVNRNHIAEFCEFYLSNVDFSNWQEKVTDIEESDLLEEFIDWYNEEVHYGKLYVCSYCDKIFDAESVNGYKDSFDNYFCSQECVFEHYEIEEL